MDENMQYGLRLRALLDRDETVYSRALRRTVIFSEQFRQKYIAELSAIHTNNAPEQVAYRETRMRRIMVRTRRLLRSMSRKPPEVLECFGELELGDVDIYAHEPLAVPVCVYLPRSGQCRSITLAATKQYLIETSGFAALSEDEVTEERVVIDSNHVTADSVVDATSRWMEKFFPKLATCMIVHMPFSDALLLKLEHLSQFGGYNGLDEMVFHALRETENS